MRTAAILPVKRFTHAKQRLGATIADPLHGDLVRAMVGDVLSALRRCASIDLTIVVTNEPAVAHAARRQSALLVPDTAEDGQSAAVALGIERARAEGVARVLCIPGDCPALDPAQLAQLLEDAAPRGVPEVVIVPDRHGTGTNGLLLRPPDAISPSFGPGSCARHQALARAAGAACRLERPASLLLDIDTGEDLAVLRRRLAGEPAGASRTSKLLHTAASPSRAA
ncbi:MAG TPA: 2-phospho-L-lactate guanylyltransferase [Solirubrobacteraceae bacterium]|nr:2-phospho-L-lactate guanylyltransferase [Solirubrobacteraceae bacterium]